MQEFDTRPGHIDSSDFGFEHVNVAQAWLLLGELHAHVANTLSDAHAAECQIQRLSASLTHQRQNLAVLRQDLYETHRLIDSLHHRFPATQAPNELVPNTDSRPRSIHLGDAEV